MKLARLILLAALLVPRVALAQFGVDGFSTHYIQGRAAFLFTAPAAGDYATLTATTGQTVTCTRASTTTVQTSPSAVAAVASGHCAVDYRGLQAEGASTNVLLQSAALQSAPWSTFGTVTVTGNAATGPDGVANLALIDMTAGASTASRNQSITVTSSVGPFAISSWERPFGASNVTGLALQCNSGNVATCACSIIGGSGSCVAGTSGQICEATSTVTGLQRVQAVATCVSAQTSLTAIVQGGSLINSVVDKAYFGDAQVEQLPFATSYIPTAGTSATRAADVVSTPTPAVVTFASGTWSASVTAQVEGIGDATVGWQALLGSSANYEPAMRLNGGNCGAPPTANLGCLADNAGSDLCSTTANAQKLLSTRYAISQVQGGNLACSSNGTTSTTAEKTQAANATTVYLGGHNAVTANALYGWISAACVASNSTGCPP